VNRYGNFGRPVLLLEAYKEWRDERLAGIENGELEEADTKADFPSWLWGPVRFSVWQGYTRIEPQYRQYARIEDMPDFRPRLIRGLNALKGFGYVGDGGEYPGMSRGERGGPSLVIDTYGGVYEITRQAIINDDSGELLNRNPSEMGYAAGIFVAEALVTLIESNPLAFDGVNFFDAGHGNVGSAAISEDAVANSISAMETRLDDSGYRIRIRAAKALVQSALQELQFKRILNSTVTGVSVNYTGGTAGIGTGYFDKGTMNPLQGILAGDAVVREPFLTDTNDWYLFADPGDVPAFGLGFLNGQEQPFVGLKDPMVRNALGPGMDPYDFEFDSVSFKVRHDFGVAAIDYRGAYKNAVS
jgi:hypothetical protein